MDQLDKFLHLYLGCNTNKGKFIGIRKEILFIVTEENQIEEYVIQNVGNSLFLYLRQLTDLTNDQSKRLIQEGVSIGRPYGYTFTNHGFVYLLSLNVDLFGLINSGFAKNIKTLPDKK
ncbi:MAG: hypothetical protein H7122_14740 [Chitinophagaceae bacterium]|nr:hypothetical protein [Chitinophagaceae bacterium]